MQIALCLVILLGVAFLVKTALENKKTAEQTQSLLEKLVTEFPSVSNHLKAILKNQELQNSSLEASYIVLTGCKSNLTNYLPVIMQVIQKIDNRPTGLLPSDIEKIKALLEEDNEAGKVIEAFELGALIKLVEDQGFTVKKNKNGNN